MAKDLLIKAREGALRLLRAIRPEEWILIGLWSLAVALCLRTDTGFNFQYVFVRYMRYFASYALVMVGVSRFMFMWADSTPVSDPRAKWLKRFIFGEEGSAEKSVATDLELMRGLLILFVNLSIYSNIKARIPAIDPTFGDELFVKLDALLFGAGSAQLLENYTRSNPEFSSWLSGVYRHDYIWMVALLWIAYIRRDQKVLRWILGATSMTYVVAILTTVLHPSYGPFFMEPERFAWVNETGIGGPQRSLKRFYHANMTKIEAGEAITAKVFLGIAAFPSLHVGHMVVMGLIALRVMPLYALWMLGVTLITWVATIAFGWHYWVDAIGGAVIAAVCTEFVWWLIRRGPGSSDTNDDDDEA